jgi:hypothetical protein
MIPLQIDQSVFCLNFGRPQSAQLCLQPQHLRLRCRKLLTERIGTRFIVVIGRRMMGMGRMMAVPKIKAILKLNLKYFYLSIIAVKNTTYHPLPIRQEKKASQ